MEQINNAACLNGCRSALNHKHGSYLRDRIKFIRIAMIFIFTIALHAIAAEGVVDRSSIGEITAFSGIADITHSSATINDGMQVGGKVYPHDIIKTRSGSVEVIFGINSRVVLGSNTELLVDTLEQKSHTKSNQLYSTSLYKLFLKKGIIRVRVRENYISSTILQLIAGDIKIEAPRTDCVLSRDNNANQSSYIGVLIAWGRAVVNKKNINDSEWNVNNEKVVVEGFNSLIPEKDIADEGIVWEKIGLEKARDAAKELPFSVDENVTGFEDIPERIPELQGA